MYSRMMRAGTLRLVLNTTLVLLMVLGTFGTAFAPPRRYPNGRSHGG